MAPDPSNTDVFGVSGGTENMGKFARRKKISHVSKTLKKSVPEIHCFSRSFGDILLQFCLAKFTSINNQPVDFPKIRTQT